MVTPSRDEWPMDTYLSAWKTFRRMSDENDATAAHLIQRPHWPNKDGLVVCDLGCGDGRLLEALLVANPRRFAEVRLLDPDAALLDEAQQCVAEQGLVSRLSPILGTAEQHFPACAEGTDVILLVHVVYLMRNGALQSLLSSCPVGTPLYVVLDAPTSVFTSLWQYTARKYHSRALRAHDLLRSLPSGEYRTDKTSFNSRIQDPLLIERVDLKAAILSILGYCKLGPSAPPETMDLVVSALQKHTVGGHLLCESDCYEIIRRR